MTITGWSINESKSVVSNCTTTNESNSGLIKSLLGQLRIILFQKRYIKFCQKFIMN